MSTSNQNNPIILFIDEQVNEWKQYVELMGKQQQQLCIVRYNAKQEQILNGLKKLHSAMRINEELFEEELHHLHDAMMSILPVLGQTEFARSAKQPVTSN